MTITVMKMQGAGNDYLFWEGVSAPPHPRRLAKVLSSRQYGIGADGLVLILPSPIADAKMVMFNSDGSEGAMCGNAIRCIGKYLFARDTSKQSLQIETKRGIKTLIKDPHTEDVWVNMGKVMPIVSPKNGVPFWLRQKGCVGYPVSVGNPHLVFFEATPSLSPARISKTAERIPCFYQGVNIEVATVESPTIAKVSVWERGSGETLSCGTGATAVTAVGMALGILKKDATISLCFKGGELRVKKDEKNHFWLGGETRFIYRGDMEIEDSLFYT